MTLTIDDTALAVLAARASSEPDAEWLKFGSGATATVGEVYEASRRFSAGLRHLGLQPGDRVEIMMSNRLEFFTTWFGIQMAGATAVPMNTTLRGAVVRQQLELVEPRIIVAERTLVGRIVDAAGSPPWLESAVILDDDPSSPHVWDGVELHQFGDVAAFEPAEVVETHPSEACAIMYTSGTTGASKGIRWTHWSSFHMANTTRKCMGIGTDDVVYTCLPLYHGNALITAAIPALIAGCPVYITTWFSVSRYWKEVKESKATVTNMLGAMTPLLLMREPSEEERSHRLRNVFVTPAPPETQEIFERRFNVQFSSAFGMTDVGMVCWTPLDEKPIPGSCGKPTPGWEMKVVDEYDFDVPCNTPGEAVLRPTEPWIMHDGYWNNPAATAELTRNMWFHTGDVMRQDEDGWFYFVERKKDIIRRRGENVSPIEVETIVLEHEEIVECAAYALPSEFAEDDVAIAVVLAPGSELKPRQIVEFVAPRLSYFAVPRFVRVMVEIPKTATTKHQKHLLRADGVTEDTWDREASDFKLVR